MADTAAQKKEYLDQFKALQTQIGITIERAAMMSAAYVDRGYDAAAADPITDVDLGPYGVVQYDMGTAINLLQQLEQLYLGQATIASAAYKVSLNKWRAV